MKILHRLFCLSLTFVFLFSSLGAAAQQTFTYPYSSFTFKIPKTAEQRFQEALEKAAKGRSSNWTLQSLEEALAKQGSLGICFYSSVAMDSEYIKTLSEEEAIAMIQMASFAPLRGECGEKFLRFLEMMVDQDYQENSANNALSGFYSLLLASWARADHHSFHKISNMLFTLIDLKDIRTTRERVWAVETLFYMSQISEEGYMLADWKREDFERRIENIILRMDYLKDLRADYYVNKNIKGSDFLSTTNQGALISLFIQANHVLSTKEDDSFITSMFKTGGLNPLTRGGTPAFSSQGEVFYLHHITPGTDGKGNMAPTPNGYRHAVLANLIQTLFTSYHTRDTQESSEKMQAFIRRYFQVNSEGEFKNYLYVPLIGMRVATIYHDDSSLYGWEKEERALQDELYSLLKDGYPWSVVCSSVQGSCEVAIEWLGFTKVFGWVFKGIGWGVKTTGRGLVKVLPRSILHKWAIARAARRSAVLWCKANIGAALKEYGWKAAVAGGTAAAVSSDTRRDDFYRY